MSLAKSLAKLCRELRGEVDEGENKVVCRLPEPVDMELRVDSNRVVLSLGKRFVLPKPRRMIVLISPRYSISTMTLVERDLTLMNTVARSIAVTVLSGETCLLIAP